MTIPQGQIPSTPRLLVLDDDPMTGRTISRAGHRAGFETRASTGPEEFFRLVDSWQPDVIALDLIMPDMDGVAVIMDLANRRCSARVILTSGAGGRVLDAAARSAAAHGVTITDVLAKPFSSQRLRDALDRALVEPGTPAASATVTPLATPTRNMLSDALRTGAIATVYQPKVRTRTGTLVGFEALSRWRHPQLGEIPPQRFVALAEQHDLIDPLTEHLMNRALEWFAALPSVLRDADDPAPGASDDLTLSLNISARSLDNPALFSTLLHKCRSLNVAPERITLEVTESSAMADAVHSLDSLTRLRLQGFQLSIDDFGTGYSSMLQLVRLPFSEIKIDKGFVLTARESAESRAVISSIVELGRSLGLQATAEGVEDAETLDYLRQVGCEFAQGFLFARPLEADQILPWMQQREIAFEQQRQQTLRQMALLDSPAEPRFDRFTRLAARVTGKPMATISLLDGERQWFKSRQGLALQETPRAISFCNHSIRSDAITVVTDATLDPRFGDSPLVTGAPHIRFYAGRPLCAPDGTKIGTLAVMDSRPGSEQPTLRTQMDHIGAAVELELAQSRAADTDALTGLAARRVFRQEAEAAIALCRKLDQPLHLLSMRLDTLASLNYSLGRDTGNRLLTMLARCCQQALTTADLLGRSRGTEVCALFMANSEAEVIAAGERLQATLAEHNANRPPDAPALSPVIRMVTIPAHGHETRLGAVLDLEGVSQRLTPRPGT